MVPPLIHRKARSILFLAIGAFCAAPASLRSYEPRWESLDQRPTPEWFLDAKFGVFIHFGVYAVPAWAPVGEYAEWNWNKIKSDKPADAGWRQFHQRNYGENFDYQDFAPRFTKKPDALDAITAGWAGKELVFRNVRVPAHVTVTLLGMPGLLKAKVVGESLSIATPDLAPDEAPCRYAYTFRIPGGEVLPEQ